MTAVFKLRKNVYHLDRWTLWFLHDLAREIHFLFFIGDSTYIHSQIEDGRRFNFIKKTNPGASNFKLWPYATCIYNVSFRSDFGAQN